MNKNNRYRYWLALLFAIAFLFLLRLLGLDRSIQAQTQKFFYPWRLAANHLTDFIYRPYRSLRRVYRSAARVQDLESRYAEALAIIGQLEAAEKENKQLRQMLRAVRPSGPTVVSSLILTYGQPLLDRGSLDGVKVGDLILARQTLLGRVEKVWPHQSLVLFLWQAKTDKLLVKTNRGAKGILRGDGQNIVIEEIGKDQPLSINDRVLTVGQLGIPANLFIGRIRQVIDLPQASAKQAYVEQLVDFYDQELVEILSL